MAGLVLGAGLVQLRAHDEAVRKARHDECRVLDIPGQSREGELAHLRDSHASREQAKANWAEFSADTEWKQIAAASEADGGKIVQKVDSVFLDATDYSPLT